MQLIRFIIIAFFAFSPLAAQNNIYISYNPTANAPGVRYDRQKSVIGVYTSINKGHYRIGEDYINDYYKTSLGILYKNFSFGTIYSKYGSYSGEFRKAIFKPVSFELGAKAALKLICVGIRFDPVKGEGSWDIGIRFLK